MNATSISRTFPSYHKKKELLNPICTKDKKEEKKEKRGKRGRKNPTEN